MEREKTSYSRNSENAWIKLLINSNLTEEKRAIFMQMLSELQNNENRMTTKNWNMLDLKILTIKMENYDLTNREIARRFDAKSGWVRTHLQKTYFKLLHIVETYVKEKK